jgi:hypothetical protein
VGQRPGPFQVSSPGRAPLAGKRTAPGKAADRVGLAPGTRVSTRHCRSNPDRLYCRRTTPSEERQQGLRGGHLCVLQPRPLRLQRSASRS